MHRWFLVAFVAFATVAAPGKLARAEPSAQIPGRVGVDGVVGMGIYELIGGSLRLELPIEESSALIARAGHLQVSFIENETNELYPLYFAHGGYRYYSQRFYASAEAGIAVMSDNREYHAARSLAFTFGAKVQRFDLGLSVLSLVGGISAGVHLGFDLAAW
jgi:hypothetical protein